MSTDHAARRPVVPLAAHSRAGALRGRQLTLGFLPVAPGAPLPAAVPASASPERPRLPGAAGQPQRELPMRR